MLPEPPPPRAAGESSPLVATQAALFAAISGLDLGLDSALGSGSRAGRRGVRSRPGAAARAAALVVGDARASAAERLHVYAHMYRSRLCEALEAEFPRLRRWMGIRAFTSLAHRYIAAHPSRSPSLRDFGRALPDFVFHAHRHRDARRLSDLARLEWARTDVFDAVDERILSLADLRAMPPESFATLPLRRVTASQVITVDGAIPDLWKAAGAGDADDPGAAIRPRRRRRLGRGRPLSSVLVWRDDVTVFHRALAEDEAAALDAAAAGTTFGLVCESLATRSPPAEAAARGFGWLSTWATDGVLAAPRA